MSHRVLSSASRRFLTGTEALVEAIVKIREMDETAGRHTGGFVTGYRGSPLGGLDFALWNAQKRLEAADIIFKPGLNEDLAATACWGTQQVGLLPQPEREGVFAFWYGKGPGVDRSVDAIKHGNIAGTARRGGVVVLFGDDHGAKSSSQAHQSEQALISAGVPIFNPSNIQEYLDYIPLAVTLSRYAGVWVGFKLVTETVESAQAVNLDPPSTSEVVEGSPEHQISTAFAPLANERSLFEQRIPAVRRFALAAGIDRVLWDSPQRLLGIVAPGKALVDVLESLRLLRIDEAKAQASGLRLFKPLMTWPLEPTAISQFARGHQEILVVEEKRALVEEQLGRVLLRLSDDERPALSGKTTPAGEELLPEYGELTPELVADAIARRLVAVGLVDEGVQAWLDRRSAEKTAPDLLAPFPRAPMFCSGCPHNRSTKVPQGSMAFGGIGCHGMASWIPGRETLSGTHMGAEGANWLGIEPFSGLRHIFQNMGDGTYAHSGLLAIRAAIAAKSNITYKLLFNQAVAMTGGQPVEGEQTPLDAARQMVAEGATRIALVTEDVSRYPSIPAGITLHPRAELDDVQTVMRDTPGVSVIIYDQGCAAERRRLRKRKEWPDPAVRTFINPAVCEGCGDCSAKSNCVSIQPRETELGVKRVIDQDSCNKDYTCTEGFCPSFVTVKGGQPRRAAVGGSVADNISRSLEPASVASATDPFNLVIVGIGGTGIISLGTTIARAAERQGLSALTFDVTGLAQKNGSVYSHIRLFTNKDVGLYRPRTPRGQLDLLLGCDIVGAAGPEIVALFDRGRTRAVVSDVVTPVASFQLNPDHDSKSELFRDLLEGALDHLVYAPALQGSSQLIVGPLLNLYLLGYAVQKGMLPISSENFEAVMTGREAERNILAFRLGRLAAQDLDQVRNLLKLEQPQVSIAALPLEEAINRYKELLAEFQNAAYAAEYESSVRAVRAADPQDRFTAAVAGGLFRVMYYKDEYEVARLFTSPAFKASLAAEFEGDYSLEFNLAPPFLAGFGRTAEPKKRKFGPWMAIAFAALSRLRFLRGTPFDPFGRTSDRMLERALVREYRGWIDALVPRLGEVDYDVAVKIAELPLTMRGYGHVKRRNVEAARKARIKLERELTIPRDRRVGQFKKSVATVA